MTRMERKSRNNIKRRIDALLIAVSVLLGAGLAMSGCGHSTAETKHAPSYVAETTASWGSFDEIRLFRYYDAGTNTDTIPKNIKYDGRACSLASVDGPFEGEHGFCFEAMYRFED